MILLDGYTLLCRRAGSMVTTCLHLDQGLALSAPLGARGVTINVNFKKNKANYINF